MSATLHVSTTLDAVICTLVLMRLQVEVPGGAARWVKKSGSGVTHPTLCTGHARP